MAVPGAGDALTPGTGTGRRGLTPLLLLGIVLICVVAGCVSLVKFWGASMGSGEDMGVWLIVLLGSLVLGLTALVAVVILARRTARS